MNTLKKLLASLFAGLLGLTLFGMAWANVGLSTIHNRTTVKGWFTKSNFYGQIVDVVLEKAKASADKEQPNGPNGPTQDKDSGIGSLPINDPAIQAVAKQAFNSQLLQTSVESFLNGSYNWLEGTAKDIDFRIDLTTAKQQLATGLGTYVTNRVAALPVCASNPNIEDYDAFSATCRPSVLSAAQAGSEFSANLLKQDFLKDPVITADSLKMEDDGSQKTALTSDSKVTAVKTAYQRSSQLPILLSLIAAVLATGIVLLSVDKLRGIRKASYVFVVTGVILLLIYLGLGAASTKLTDKLTLSGSGSPQQTKLMIDFGKVIISDVRSAFLPYTIVYLVLGIAGITVVYIIKKRQTPGGKPQGTATEDDKKEPETKPEEEPKPAEDKQESEK